MAWYDVFSAFYDASLEPHYREQRELAAQALRLAPGMTVVDLPCGTGQSFPHLVAGVGPEGRVMGVDLSAGMARQARARAGRMGASQVTVLQQDALSLGASDLGGRSPDRIHVFLGMTVFPDPGAVLANLWNLLAPGGRLVLVDVHTERLTLQGRMVNMLARADITRRWWEPLEHAAGAQHFERRQLPSKPLHGGAIWLAAADKSRGG